MSVQEVTVQEVSVQEMSVQEVAGHRRLVVNDRQVWFETDDVCLFL